MKNSWKKNYSAIKSHTVILKMLVVYVMVYDFVISRFSKMFSSNEVLSNIIFFGITFVACYCLVVYQGFIFPIIYNILVLVCDLVRWAIDRYLGRTRTHPPCLPTLPIVGSYFAIPSYDRLPRFFAETSKKLGNVFAFYMGRK